MPIVSLVDQQNLLDYVDNFRLEASRALESGRRSDLGQFFTPPPVARTLASMLAVSGKTVRILDPGAGVGILSAAVVSRLLEDNPEITEIEVVSYEIESALIPYLEKTMQLCAQVCLQRQVEFVFEIYAEDFIQATVESLRGHFLGKERRHNFNIAILNPPYHKVGTRSQVRRLLSGIGIETPNLYAGFMGLAAQLLVQGGQLVSITPRSFCNGPYFRSFRKAFLKQMRFNAIHVYDSRQEAFSDDDVLQENIIIHAVKDQQRDMVRITSSTGPLDDFATVFTVSHDEIVRPSDSDAVIYVPTNGADRQVQAAIRRLECSLADLNLSVSTGRVVDFRAKELLRIPHQGGSAPLIYPGHFDNGFVTWPVASFRKPSAIAVMPSSAGLLVPSGYYVLVKRFSSKEEKRRIVAAVYDPTRIDAAVVGFENHLNYYHQNGKGLPVDLAKGLAAFLNSSLVDWYFRQFSGHTQVNATDLRSLKYPDTATLQRLGAKIGEVFPEQKNLDTLVFEELGMSETNNPFSAKQKIQEALEILRAIGVPKAQQNERSALTLLTLLDLKPDDAWSDATSPLRGVTQMMDYFFEHYGVRYAPNTRETVRRQTIHQFWQLGIVVPNPDQPDRPVNSPRYCYQISGDMLRLARHYGSDSWDEELAKFLEASADKLRNLHARERNMTLIPVTLPDGSEIKITAGGQNELIKEIVEEFCPRFTKGGEIVYLGDAGGKLTQENLAYFASLGIELDEHGKAPDVVVYMRDKNWLVLIEAVTSHGPIDRKRHNELIELFGSGSAGLVFVTAFRSRQEMAKWLAEISWETEVWTADAPSHLIHFDGERFLGPYLEQ